MFQLEIDYGWCGGWCKACKLSSFNGTPRTTFSQTQKTIISRIVRIFWVLETQHASLSFANCVTAFWDKSDFPDLSVPVVDLLLHVKTRGVNVDAVLRWIILLLHRYSEVQNLTISFYRWSTNLELQQYALQHLVAGIIDSLSSRSDIQTLGFGFWANDCENVDYFQPIHTQLFEVSDMSGDSAVVESLRRSYSSRIDDIIDIQNFWLENFFRRSLLFSLPQDRKIWFFLFLEKNNLRYLSSEQAIWIVWDIQWFSFHISPNHTFLYHHPLLARIPGLIITHEETHELLNSYEDGQSFSALLEASIRKHSSTS